jgi:type I restriction enzyme R subunit
MSTFRATNFACLQDHDDQLVRLGMLAERYFTDDPNSCLIKLRQFAELLAQNVAARAGLFASREEVQFELLRRLRERGILPREIWKLFNEIRRKGNAATHAMADDHPMALDALKISWQLGLWFHRTFAEPSFNPGPFIPPAPPEAGSEELRVELERLNEELARYRAGNYEAIERLEDTEGKVREVIGEGSFWERLAVEAEEREEEIERRLAALQAFAAESGESVERFVQSAEIAAGKVQVDREVMQRLRSDDASSSN